MEGEVKAVILTGEMCNCTLSHLALAAVNSRDTAQLFLKPLDPTLYVQYFAEQHLLRT